MSHRTVNEFESGIIRRRSLPFRGSQNHRFPIFSKSHRDRRNKDHEDDLDDPEGFTCVHLYIKETRTRSTPEHDQYLWQQQDQRQRNEKTQQKKRNKQIAYYFY